jgi:hypothetical protein
MQRKAHPSHTTQRTDPTQPASHTTQRTYPTQDAVSASNVQRGGAISAADINIWGQEVQHRQEEDKKDWGVSASVSRTSKMDEKTTHALFEQHADDNPM